MRVVSVARRRGGMFDCQVGICWELAVLGRDEVIQLWVWDKHAKTGIYLRNIHTFQFSTQSAHLVIQWTCFLIQENAKLQYPSPVWQPIDTLQCCSV